MAEFYSLAEFGRIWQNSMAWQSLAEFGRILWPSRVWQNLAEFHGLAELGRIWQKRQIAVGCGKLQSHAQSLLAESVEIGSGVLQVCFIILC